MMISRLLACLGLCFALALSACSNDTPEQQATESASEAPSVQEGPTEPDPPALSAPIAEAHAELALPPPNAPYLKPWTGDLDGMEERRVIRVLTTYGIGRYYLHQGQQRGLIYELLKGFEQSLNKELANGHLKVQVVFIPVGRDQLIPELVAGRGDVVAAGLTVTEEREDLVDFTRPFSKPVEEILITGPSAPEVATLEDLSGKTVYLRHSSSYRESVEILNDSLTEQGLDPVLIESVDESLEDDDLIEMVNSGLLPWTIVDNYKTELWDGVFTHLKVREDLVFRSGGRLAWAIRKDSPKLESALNTYLKTHRQGTLFGNILVNRYLRDFNWAENALSDDDLDRLHKLLEVFQRYGEEYGIDYLMAAAQGYQESRLRQDARSAAGAIGIMQLLPTTAADPNVGIKDIHQADGNIHAGVKYLSFLRNRYFNDPAITRQDQTLLALAAYNAGPARLAKLRSMASEQGYDPNRWFDNVEVVAAQQVGRETVQYVSNIYKYYMAYRLSLSHLLHLEEARIEAGLPAAVQPD